MQEVSGGMQTLVMINVFQLGRDGQLEMRFCQSLVTQATERSLSTCESR